MGVSLQVITRYSSVVDKYIYLLPLHWLLYVSTIFVNKYVLSILHFTYPTIFQGWQTLVGAIVLRLLTVIGKIDLSVSDINRSNTTPWIPPMLFFIGMIYGGSKALAKLPIPIFMSVHCLVHVVNEVGFWIVDKKINISPLRLWSLIIVAYSAVFVTITDPQFDGGGYTWLGVHLICAAAIRIYSKVCATFIKLSHLDKLYCNYWCSVIVLAPSSYFLGDALEAKKFPFLYFYKFYFGCVMSGLCGVFLNLCAIRLTEKSEEVQNEYVQISSHQSSAFAKILVCALSFLVYDMTISGPNMLWISVCLCANLVNKLDGSLWPSPSEESNKWKLNGSSGVSSKEPEETV